MPAGFVSLLLFGISASAEPLPPPPGALDEFAVEYFLALEPASGPALLSGRAPARKPHRYYPRLKAYVGGNGPVSPRNPKADAAPGDRPAEPVPTCRHGNGSHTAAATSGSSPVPRIYLLCTLLL